MILKLKTTKDLSTIDIVPLSKFNDYFEFPLVSALRYFHFNNTNNFADKVIRIIGGRVYIKISALKKWTEESSQKKSYVCKKGRKNERNSNL